MAISRVDLDSPVAVHYWNKCSGIISLAKWRLAQKRGVIGISRIDFLGDIQRQEHGRRLALAIRIAS